MTTKTCFQNTLIRAVFSIITICIVFILLTNIIALIVDCEENTFFRLPVTYLSIAEISFMDCTRKCFLFILFYLLTYLFFYLRAYNTREVDGI